jgi:beta-lactamase regulating signal transducer with metallopeptidase domain
MTLIPEMHAIAQLCSVGLLDCMVEGALVAICAAGLLRVLKNPSAGMRFAVWFSALLAIAAFPLLRGWSSAHANGLAGINSRGAEITLPSSWALYLFAAWMLIAAVGLLRLALGLGKLHSLRRDLLPMDTERLPIAIQRKLRAPGRQIMLCTSDQMRVPTALGLIKPAVVIPRWVLEDLSAEEVGHLVVHEFTHLRRWDDWSNLAQQVIKALFFFHPAVWWIERKMSLEREMACDEAVIAASESPRTYAECLTRLAEKSLLHRTLALAQAALGQTRQLSMRVARILEANGKQNLRSGWKVVAGLSAGFAVVCGIAISKAPDVVAFKDVPSSVHAAVESLEPASLPIAHVQTASWRPDVEAASSRAMQGVTKKAVRPVNRNAMALSKNAGANPQVQIADIISPAPAPSGTTLARTLVHLASASTISSSITAVSVQTVFVLVQDPARSTANAPAYEIRMWRVVVVRPAKAPASQISRKET